MSHFRRLLCLGAVVPLFAWLSSSGKPATCLHHVQGEQNQIMVGALPSGDPPNACTANPYLVVLGIAQDAGYPQAGCRKPCCAKAWSDPALRRHPVCLAVVDPRNGVKRWMIECTPEFRDQLRALDEIAPVEGSPGLEGILLTHAHIGHYAGLIHLGREVMGASSVPVYAMPKMSAFLANNGPWSQLVSLKNIELRGLAADTATELAAGISVTPLLVPHRDEFSETVGFIIAGPKSRVLFLPDIDKWERWNRKIEDVIAQVDVAYLDGSFHTAEEIPGRDLKEIPHPLILESMARFGSLPEAERSKIRFLHFNHTNDALRSESPTAQAIREAGFRIAQEGERIEL